MINVAVAGLLPQDENINRQLNNYLQLIQEYLNMSEGSDELQLLASPDFASVEWLQWASQYSFDLKVYESAVDPVWNEACCRTVFFEGAIRDTIGDALCNRADLLLMVWNEDVKEMDGASWALLGIALRKHLPCIWISTRTKETYWQEKTVYDTYEQEKLHQTIRLLTDAHFKPITFEQPLPFMLRAGAFLYNRFLGKNKASHLHTDTENDCLLRDDYQIGAEYCDAEACRQQLLSHYHRFDRAAIMCNDLYQSVLYWRAVLPWVTTIFVAVGFYATGVFAVLPLPFKVNWGIVAGVGFLIHGLLNLYVFMLSKSPKIKAYQTGMIVNRQMAEMLRILIHFIPFGIYPDLRYLCVGNQMLYATLRRIIQEAEPQTRSRRISREVYVEAFRHTNALLSDQIAYHRRSVERYSGVVRHLEHWSHIAFYIGFCFILIRAGLQFVMSFPQIAMPNGTFGNGVKLMDFIPSFANMLALLFPAWYSFFANKLSLCNFRFNLDNHQRMLTLLNGEKDNFMHLERIIDVASAEVLQTISESLVALITEKDTFVWSEQYKGTRVQHL